MFHKILIANRGEIALRIIRTCRELGIRSVLAHSKADAHSLPMRLADEALEVADRSGYPVIFKAGAGGGGRGMRIVKERAEAMPAFDACQSEAGAAFGSSEVYCEKFIQNARHVEVQVLGDRNGLRVHLGERDCSVQRRHQKRSEERRVGKECRSRWSPYH